MGAPEWAAILAAGLALLGVLITAVVSFRANQQMDIRWRTELEALEVRTRRAGVDEERRDRRDQAMAAYRWAAELAVSDDPAKADVGVDQLTALLRSTLLDEDLKILVVAALESTVKAPREAIEAAENGGGGQARVLEATLEDRAAGGVRSIESDQEGERAEDSPGDGSPAPRG